MKEAYLKVLGLDQKPLEEKKMGRPSWVPESIKDDKVSDFMGALSAAHKEGYEEFEFGNKKFKMSFAKKDAKETDVKEELSPKQKKIDHNKNGKIDGEDLAKIRNEDAPRKMELRSDEKKVGGKVVRDTEKPPFDPPYSTRKIATPGKSGYGPSAAKHLAKQGMKKTYEDIEIEEFAQDLLENGFSQDEVDSIIAGLDEKKHVGTDGPEPAEAEEMGDTLSDGEMDFIDTHDIEITDMTPEDPKHHEATKKATPPTTKGIGTAEVDGQKIVAAKPEVAVKSQATQPK